MFARLFVADDLYVLGPDVTETGEGERIILTAITGWIASSADGWSPDQGQQAPGRDDDDACEDREGEAV